MLTLRYSAGGMKAWKEMQQRQMEFYRGFDQESPTKSKPSDEDFDAEYSQDVKAHLEDGARCEEAEDKPDEDDEPVSFFPAPSLTAAAYWLAGIHHGAHAPQSEYRFLASGI